MQQHVKHVLKDHAFESCLEEERLGFLQFFEDLLLELLVLFDVDVFKNREGEGSIEAAAISSGFAIRGIVLVQFLHFDVEPLVIRELIQHQRNRPKLADEGRLSLDLLSDAFLLLHVELQLLLVFGLIRLIALHSKSFQFIV